MGVWRWLRARRWWIQLPVFLFGPPLLLVAVYVAGRTVQYWTAEGDAGVFAPGSAQGLVRLRDLERHVDRLEESYAWRTIRRKVLRDPALRPLLNAAMKDAGLPSLDDLEDVRQSHVYSKENLLRAAGRDFLFAARVGDAWNSARFCVVTRLRWSDYLAAPLARFVLREDQGALRTPGRLPLWIAFEGSLAIAANNPDLLADARRGRGGAPHGAKPVEARVRIEKSRALQELLELADRSGVLPHLKLATTRAVGLTADVDGGALLADVALEGTEPAREGAAAPAGAEVWAPSTTTGIYATSAHFADVQAWMRTLGKENVASELERWDRYGFSSALLPKLDAGMALVLGTHDDGAAYYPAFVLFVPSTDPAGAAAALTDLVKGTGGSAGRNILREWSAGSANGYHVNIPPLGGYEEFLEPCWAAVPGGLLFGNNLPFTQAAAAAAADGIDGGLRQRRSWKRLGARVKQLGFPAEPGLLGGVFLPPAIRESLDGVLKVRGKFLAEAAHGDSALRAEVDAEQQAAGLPPLTDTQATPLVTARRHAKIQERQDRLRADVAVLDALRWAALSSSRSPSGLTLSVALGFDALDNR
jgi:hypothetical protein